jgi:hypothetical protein
MAAVTMMPPTKIEFDGVSAKHTHTYAPANDVSSVLMSAFL